MSVILEIILGYNPPVLHHVSHSISTDFASNMHCSSVFHIAVKCKQTDKQTNASTGKFQNVLTLFHKTYPSLPASAEKFPPSNSPGTFVTIDSPVLAASVPLHICRNSCNTLMSCDWSPPSDTDTFISLTGVHVMVLRVAMVLRKT